MDTPWDFGGSREYPTNRAPRGSASLYRTEHPDVAGSESTYAADFEQFFSAPLRVPSGRLLRRPPFRRGVLLLEWPLPRRVASELFCAEPHLLGRPEFGDTVYLCFRLENLSIAELL